MISASKISQHKDVYNLFETETSLFNEVALGAEVITFCIYVFLCFQTKVVEVKVILHSRSVQEFFAITDRHKKLGGI